MKLRILLGLCVFMGGALAMTQSVSASDKKTAKKRAGSAQADPKGYDQDGRDHDARGEGETDADAAMMEAWAQMSAPGEYHKHLGAFVGDWTYVIKMRFAPDAEWSESTGTSTTKWIMGKRYTLEEVESKNPEMPFHGMGFTGYDKIKQKYLGTWVDTMGTSIMYSVGTCDDSGKVFTYKGTADDPMTGGRDVPYKWVIRVINPNKYTSEYWAPGPDGKVFKSMELTYTRK